jgi:hypothetical protein
MKQLDVPLCFWTPKGKAWAHFVIDYGMEHDLLWVCFQNDTGECWTWNNKDVRLDQNFTYGRKYEKPNFDVKTS